MTALANCGRWWRSKEIIPEITNGAAALNVVLLNIDALLNPPPGDVTTRRDVLNKAPAMPSVDAETMPVLPATPN